MPETFKTENLSVHIFNKKHTIGMCIYYLDYYLQSSYFKIMFADCNTLFCSLILLILIQKRKNKHSNNFELNNFYLFTRACLAWTEESRFRVFKIIFFFF